MFRTMFQDLCKFFCLVFLEITHARYHLQCYYFLGLVDTLNSSIYFRNFSTRVELKLLLTVDLAVIETMYNQTLFL